MCRLLALIALFVTACDSRSVTGGDRDLVKSEPLDGTFVDQPGILGEQVDCEEAYGEPAACVRIKCPADWAAYIGSWEGPWVAHVEMPTDEDERRERFPFYDALKAAIPRIEEATFYRPFDTTLRYYSRDCLLNTKTGDEIVIGRQVDAYPMFQNMPAFERAANVVSGRHADGTRFLRIGYEREPVFYYRLVSHDPASDLFQWEAHLDETATRPELTFRIIDGRDMSVTETERRYLHITLSVAQGGTTIFSGILGTGVQMLIKP